MREYGIMDAVWVMLVGASIANGGRNDLEHTCPDDYVCRRRREWGAARRTPRPDSLSRALFGGRRWGCTRSAAPAACHLSERKRAPEDACPNPRRASGSSSG